MSEKETSDLELQDIYGDEARCDGLLALCLPPKGGLVCRVLLISLRLKGSPDNLPEFLAWGHLGLLLEPLAPKAMLSPLPLSHEPVLLERFYITVLLCCINALDISAKLTLLTSLLLQV